MNDKYIGLQIKKIRCDHKMSQNTLATKLGVSASIISGYECGTRIPSVDVLIKLKNIFNVSYDYFFDNYIEENARLTIDVTDLTADQLVIIGKLISEFTMINNIKRTSNKD